MPILIWLVSCLIVVSFVLLLPALWRRAIQNRYASPRPVTCPENREPAVVNIDAEYAATREMDGHSEVRLCDCTRWPERAKCNQACLAQAIAAEPYPEAVLKGRKQIYHLPIALAAFAAWFLGALWHSQFMFRARWTEAVGLTHAQVKQIVWWVWPHLLAVGMCILFAYGVAWLLAVRRRKGLVQGILMSILLYAAVLAACAFYVAKMPHDLLIIEAGYTILATLAMGAIVGGLYDKLVLTSE